MIMFIIIILDICKMYAPFILLCEINEYYFVNVKFDTLINCAVVLIMML